jgi:formate hydrogenlyase transcriptional activator
VLKSLRLLIDSIPALIHSGPPDGSLDFFNQRWLDYVGLSLENLLGWKWTASIHPEDVEEFVKKSRLAVAKGEPFEHEARIRRADGEYRWMLHRNVPLRDGHGNIVRWYGSSIDVEDLKQAQEQIRQHEKELSKIIDTIPAFIITAAPDGSIDFYNQSVLDYAGLSREELLGRGWMTVTHPEDLDRLVEGRQAGFAAGVSYGQEGRYRRANGEYRWFVSRNVPVRDDKGNIVKWYGTLHDIDDRKRAEEQVRQREAEIQQILDAAPQYIAVLGPDRSRLYLNQAALEFFGLTLDEWKTCDPRRTWHPEDWERVSREIQTALSTGSPLELEIRARRRDGEYRWCFVRYKPLRDQQGCITRWVVAGMDIDDRKRAEERLHHENIALREEIDKASMFEEIVGVSPALEAVLRRVAKVAPTDSTVFITGETGTGKELIARTIHKRSHRSSRAFVSVSCAAIPVSLIASELFGHEKGAFTGALQRRLGRFELAEGGTIFLDEIGELPIETQIALLRVLQEHEYERVGGNQTLRANVRVLAATNRDLKAAIEAGTFRRDLFYRLNVFPIQMPPLRERKEDIPILVEYFIDRYASKAGKKIRAIDKKSLDLLQSYPWPGNIRELQNVIERSIILCDTEIFLVDESWLVRESPQTQPASHRLSDKLVTQEKEIIEAALNESRGRVSGPKGAATKLGMPPSTLESKIKSLKINKQRFKLA